jgi:hypothetical protein
MKAFAILLILFAFFPFRLAAQRLHDVIVKSELFRNLNSNYNVGFETILNERFSVGVEGVRVTRESARNGGEGAAGIPTLPYQHKSKGYRVEIFGRYYFGNKRYAPNAFFAATILSYNSTRVNGLDMQEGISGMYVRTIDLVRKGPALGISTGRQFYLFRKITGEVSLGISNYFISAKEIFISGQSSADFVDGKYKYRENQLSGQLQFKIGYFFGKKHKPA